MGLELSFDSTTGSINGENEECGQYPIISQNCQTRRQTIKDKLSKNLVPDWPITITEGTFLNIYPHCHLKSCFNIQASLGLNLLKVEK